MLQIIINYLNQQLSTLNYWEELMCLCEIKEDGKGIKEPMAYISQGQWKAVNFDNTDGVGYWRERADAIDSPTSNAYSPRKKIERTYRLRFVFSVRRSKLSTDDAYSFQRIADTVAATVTADQGPLLAMLGATSVKVVMTSREGNAHDVWGGETEGTRTLEPRYDFVYGALNVDVVVLADVACFVKECDNTDTDLLHTFNFCLPTVIDRLTENQVECLEAALCVAPPTLCEQLAVVLAADVVADVFDCLTEAAQNELLDSECIIPPCAPASISINGTAYDDVASGGALDIPVINSDDVAVGSLVGSDWVIANSLMNINGTNVGNIEAEDTANKFVKANSVQIGSWDNPSQTWNIVVKQSGVQVGSNVGNEWIVPPCPAATSLTASPSNATPAHGASVTITATPTGIIPTSYSFAYPVDSVGCYATTTQAGAALVITARGYGAQKIYVTATDGVTTVGATVTITVAQMVEVTDFFAVTAISDATIQGAVRTLALRFYDLGFWSKIRALYPIVGGTATTHKFNLKDPRDLDAAYRMVFSGGWTHSSTGMLGNGVNNTADTKLANNVMGQNSLSMGFYNRTAGAAGYDMSGSVTPRTVLAANQGGSTVFENNNGAGTTPTTPPASTLGLWVANRQGATYAESYLNGGGWRTTAAASSAPTATNITVGAFSGGGVNSARSYAFVFIGDGLTAVDVANMYSFVQEFNTTLARQV